MDFDIREANTCWGGRRSSTGGPATAGATAKAGKLAYNSELQAFVQHQLTLRWRPDTRSVRLLNWLLSGSLT